MKAIRLITVAFCLSLLTSCSLLNSLLKIPTSILTTLGRTAGVVRLTDDEPQPFEPVSIEESQEKKEVDSE